MHGHARPTVACDDVSARLVQRGSCVGGRGASHDVLVATQRLRPQRASAATRRCAKASALVLMYEMKTRPAPRHACPHDDGASRHISRVTPGATQRAIGRVRAPRYTRPGADSPITPAPCTDPALPLTRDMSLPPCERVHV